ncbi:HpcH/HpaI aldolase/citrate lyase family protein [Nocardia sp. NBC_01327]|uniref:HpcH/HpaI aldolase/citrate lyase family protein n=1 Tax=Nocardia sp. NBC_01327 TaxID=2903593 RepID=UPI002E1160AE|nr:CoA ester lyase [Nocardia sp. NBC_01327]
MSWDMPGPAWLFCPADRPERFEKAATAADVVIIDLEDGVAEADKAAAREALIAHPQDPERTVIRVNAAGTVEHMLDLDALLRTEYRRLMLPKCESAEQITRMADYEVIALIESPLGAMAVGRAVMVRNAIGVMWGAEDLVAALGGNSSRHADGGYRDVALHVRSQSLLAAKAYGKFALDSVFLNIADLEGLAEESLDAVSIGFDAKVAIHPSQVPVIRRAYAPVAKEVDWAQRLLAEVPNHRGVFTFEGRMVDMPVIRHAERIVTRAQIAGSTGFAS